MPRFREIDPAIHVPFPELGCGAYRVVHGISEDLALKVQCGRRGNDNENEVRVWESVKGTVWEKYFCPIIAVGPGFEWLIVKRLPAGSQWATDYDGDDYDKLLDDVWAVGDAVGLTDLHGYNWAVVDGKPWITDYGIPYGEKWWGNDDNWSEKRQQYLKEAA